MNVIESAIINRIKYLENVNSASRRIYRTSDHDRVYRYDDVIRVELYSTIIAEIYPDMIRIHTNGYKTKTTKNRINVILTEFCNVSIYQRNFQWYYTNNGKAGYVYDLFAIPEKSGIFVENMEFKRI